MSEQTFISVDFKELRFRSWWGLCRQSEQKVNK